MNKTQSKTKEKHNRKTQIMIERKPKKRRKKKIVRIERCEETKTQFVTHYYDYCTHNFDTFWHFICSHQLVIHTHLQIYS